jgi:hypothetical protein
MQEKVGRKGEGRKGRCEGKAGKGRGKKLRR